MDQELHHTNLIEKSLPEDSPKNFGELREKGIALLQQYAGKEWTDFNLHDPGVTILEYLCYAITDLAYRTDFPINDLLTGSEGQIRSQKNLFYSRRDVLNTHPVTTNDLRKLILDVVPEVYNVWLEKVYSNQSSGYIKGLYQATVQMFDNDDILANPAAKEDLEKIIARKVETVIHAHRNLGEDFIQCSILQACPIEIEANIVLDRHTNPEEILAEVYVLIQQALNPAIHFYSETELLQKGMSLESIYSGPMLQHGFLLDEEMDARVLSMDSNDLKKSTRYRVVDPADVLRAISSVPGIAYVRDFRLKADGHYYAIPFRLPNDRYPSFRFHGQPRTIHVSGDTNEIILRESLFQSILSKKEEGLQRKYIPEAHIASGAANKTAGIYRNPGNYYSIQQLFPPVYRLNMTELESAHPGDKKEDMISAGAKAQVKQLKAYLLFFEQILANYLAQLANLDNLLSADITDASASYYSQPLYAVPAIANVLKDFQEAFPNRDNVDWEYFQADQNNAYMRFLREKTESPETFLKRKNEVLDHLLSRFNLNLNKYPVLFFNQVYHSVQSEGFLSDDLRWKAGFLKDFLALSSKRSQAPDYRQPVLQGSTQRSGFEVLLCRLLYIQDHSERRLSDLEAGNLSNLQVRPRDFYAVKQEAKRTNVTLEWPGKISMDVQVDADWIPSGDEENPGGGKEQTMNDQLNLSSLPIRFLREGLDKKNYRIGPGFTEGSSLLLYKAPADARWLATGRFDATEKAEQALEKLLEALRNVSIASEGFHLVEHILLRPSPDAQYFGFNFRDDKGLVLFYQKSWMDFMERERLQEEILSIADLPDDTEPAEIAGFLHHKCWVNYWQQDANTKEYQLQKSYDPLVLFRENPVLADRIFRKMIRNIRLLRKKRMTRYPCVENIVNRLHDSDIREEFFDFRMSVVLPAWPARFQDPGFRQVTESLFREYSPAHLKLQFFWLGPSRMKKFEDVYFEWRAGLQMDNRDAEQMVKNDRLISFIHGGIFSIL